MLGWTSLCNNVLPYLWLFPLARSLVGESLNQRAWTSLRFFEHSAKLLPCGLLSFGSTWWKMSLIAEDRQGQAREKEHSKHSSRKRHSGVTEAAAPVICCPDMKALLVAPAVFRKPALNSSLQGQLCSRHTGLSISSWSTPRLLPPQGFCIYCIPLLGMLFPQNLFMMGLLIHVSFQMSNAQRGHFWWPALRKKTSLASGYFYQVDFILRTYYSYPMSMFNSYL